jgi:hypothetical protein
MIYTCVHIIIRKNRGRFVRAHSLCALHAHTADDDELLSLSAAAAEYSPECVCILSGSIIAPFIQIDAAAAARVCRRAHVYVPSLFIRPPKSKPRARSRPDLYGGDVVYSTASLSLYMCVRGNIYVCICSERENVSLAASERIVLAFDERLCVCARAAAPLLV